MHMGRPIKYGAGEVRGFTERARYLLSIARTALADVEIPTAKDKPGIERLIRREPFGVVLLISPWNFPYLCQGEPALDLLQDPSLTSGPVNTLLPALLAETRSF